MSSAPDQVVSGYQSGSPRQRLISSLLSAAIILLAVLIAIYQTAIAPQLEKKARNPVTFDMSDKNDKGGAKAPKKQEEAKQTKQKAETQKTQQVQVAVPVPEPKEAEQPAFTFLKMSHSDMAAADIGQMKQSGGGSGPSGGPRGSTYGPGEGPGGSVLYNADWYKEPTNAQLSGYLPASAPQNGWGEIACQTIERNRVDNCQILGESPRGSGFGRAVLNAAWQFQVRPPRLNGKPQVGEWVRIRITYGTKGDDNG